MSETSDIAGSEDVILLSNETQDTFNDQSYRSKQAISRSEKTHSISPAKENQKPPERAPVLSLKDDGDSMETEMPNHSHAIQNNGVTAESSPDTQNNPFLIRTALAQSTLTDGSSMDPEKDPSPVKSPNEAEKETRVESTSKEQVDAQTTTLDTSAAANNLRLYISPSTSLLEATNVESNPEDVSTAEAEEPNGPPKEEPMDAGDAQTSLGSDGMIEPQARLEGSIESTSVPQASTETTVPIRKKVMMSPNTKAAYALSQPATNKFETMLAKLVTSPVRQVAATSSSNPTAESNVTIREEEELFIKESVSKIVRRYTVKIDQQGRTISRDLMNERVVEENTTTRIEAWPSSSDKKTRRPTLKAVRTSEVPRKKQTKPMATKRTSKSLKPTSTAAPKRKSKIIQSDDDDDEPSKTEKKAESSNDEEDDGDEESDSQVTENVSGDEFEPPSTNRADKTIGKGSRVFAKWVDGHYYPGAVGNISGEKYMIEFDDGAKRYVKSNEIISQNYLQVDQDVMAQTQDGYFDRGVVKRLIKKKRSGKLGYVVEKDGKEKWYPLRLISLTEEQAEHLPFINRTSSLEPANTTQNKRKRTSTAPQSPNKKSKSSISVSPSKSQRTTYTPTRQTKLFNSMSFLLTGFNDIMEIRHDVQESIESHGGKVIEKMPTANRRDRVYLISDIARKTAKFFEAKKLHVPCVNYKWINESIAKSEVQDWETYKLVLPEKESSTNEDILDAQKED